MAIRVIPARPTIQTINGNSGGFNQPKLKVGAYCRISTELESQEGSYEAQVRHYTDLINKNPLWEMAGIFADEGITGTQAKKRPGFLRMIEECKAGNISMVITKSISRFARNTLECLQYIRLLKERNIAIYFESENINTLDAKGELLITIMASIAQQESLSISQNVRMGIQYRFQQGRPMLNHSWFLGYTKERNGDLQIVPEEAVIVRRIYRDYLEGLSLGEICQSLEKDGIKTGAGKDKWYETSIKSMLRNEKYMGDLLLQKTYTQDVLTKKPLKNEGVFPQYYVENAHEPIVPREIFMRVQGEFLRRENVKLTGGIRKRIRSNIGLNNRLVCSECGATYRRVKGQGQGQRQGNELNKWRCRTRMQKGKQCDGRILKESLVQEVVIEAFNRLPDYRDELIRKQEQIRGLPLLRLKQELEQVEDQKDQLEMAISTFAETGRLPENSSFHSFAVNDPNMAGDGNDDRDEVEDEDGVDNNEELIISQIKEKLDSLKQRHRELLSQKAEYDIQDMQIMTLLELIDDMTSDAATSATSASTASATFDSEESQSREKERETNEKTEGETDNETTVDMSGEEIREQEIPACYDIDDFFRRTNRHDHHGPITEFSDDDVIRYLDTITVFPEKMVVMFKADLEIEVAE